MARKIDDIQRDIERTRKQLAGTLDELAQRTKPGNLVNDAKSNLLEKLQSWLVWAPLWLLASHSTCSRGVSARMTFKSSSA